MRKLATLAAITIAAFLLADSAPHDARAAFPGTNGRITYQDMGNGQIWVMDPNGSNKTQVTDISGPAERPAFTADGESIVYNSETGVRRVEVDGPSDDGYPGTDGGTQASVAPDGEIAYQLNGDIIAGGVNITNTPVPMGFEFQPDYSPDGEMVLFSREIGGGQADLFLVPASGGEPTNITNTPDVYETSGDWSPDGEQVIFDASPMTGPERVDIARVDVDGNNYVYLTDFGADFDPAFSPDGDFFVFHRQPGGLNRTIPQGGGPSNIMVANSDGTNAHSISGPGTPSHRNADWGVDEPFVAPDLVWGDVNCDGSRDAEDALYWLSDNAGTAEVPNGCPAIGDEFGAQSFGTLMWGNLDCSEGIDTADVVLLLMDAADLPVDTPQGCPALFVEIVEVR